MLQISGLALDFTEGTIGRFKSLLLLGKFKAYVGESFSLMVAGFARTLNSGFQIGTPLALLFEPFL